MQTTSKSGRKLLMPTDAEEAAINRGIAADPDNPELGDAFFANARPAAEVLGADVVASLAARRKPGRPEGSTAKITKTQVTLRLDPDVIEGLKASGKGWQSRVNALLRADIESGRLEKVV